MAVNWSLQHKRDTAANWTSNNPTLLAGQLGIETDNLTTTPKFKIGDGTSTWTALPYFYGGSASAQDLNNVLSVGNTTSGNNIVMSGTDVISDSTGTNMFVDLNASTIYSTDGYNRMAFTADISGKTSEISVRDYSVISLEKGYVRAGITDIYSGVISQSAGWYNQIHTNLNHIEVQSNWANFRGIEYLNDWSANYSLRSLVDKGYVINNFVPYTGATSDVDLGTFLLSTKSIRVTGTSGSGDIHLRHQSTDATATGQSTSLFADVDGNIKWKNDGNYYTTLKTSNNTGNRIYSYPDADGTIALTSNIGTWGALNYPTWVSGTPFVKMTAAGTFALDTNTYLTTSAAALAYQPLDADLTSWASVTRASGFDTFVTTPNSANLASLVTDETGSGSLVFGTQPTFTQWITVPRVYGGTGVSDGIDFYSTSGNGTSSSVAHRFLGGNNGATTILTMLNDGTIRIPNNRVIQGTDSGGTNRALISWSGGDNITINGRPGTTDIVLNPTSGGVGLYVKSGGDGGIGVASPSARWHIIKTTEQLRVGYDASNYASHTISSTGSLTLGLTGTTPEMYFNNTGGVVIGNKAALATNATDGFLYVPSCAGIPTGVPTAKTGKIAVVCDSTNNKMYIYSGGAWVALN